MPKKLNIENYYKFKRILNMKLNIKALIITGAVIYGGSVFIEVLVGGAWQRNIFCVTSELAKLISLIYPRVSLTVKGAFIALLYGLFDGGFFAGIFGWLYNRLSGDTKKSN